MVSSEEAARWGIYGSVLLPRALQRTPHATSEKASEAVIGQQEKAGGPDQDTLEDDAYDGDELDFDDAVSRGSLKTQFEERGQEPKSCPFSTQRAMFGPPGTMVKVCRSTLDDMMDRRFGIDSYQEGILQLFGLRAREHGAVARQPVSRRVQVTLRRQRDGSIIVSRRGNAGKPVPRTAVSTGVLRIHCADQHTDEDVLEDYPCELLAPEPIARWRVPRCSAWRFERALRRTDELIELGVQIPHGKLAHSTWLMGTKGGRANALGPILTYRSMSSVGTATYHCVGDTCIAKEVGEELTQLNQTYGIEVPDHPFGALDARSAWEIFMRGRLNS
jgi:hypothetical protein